LFDVLNNSFRPHLKYFIFNHGNMRLLRKSRILPTTLLTINSHFYKIKRQPHFSNFFIRKHRVIEKPSVLSSNKKLKTNRFLNTKIFEKKLKFLKRSDNYSCYRVPGFIQKKILTRKIRSAKPTLEFRKGVKYLATPFKYYPTTMFTAKLTRLTISIFNEARSVGVILLYLNSGVVSPEFTYYNIIISDRERFLPKLELIFKNVYATSKISLLIGRNMRFIAKV